MYDLSDDDVGEKSVKRDIDLTTLKQDEETQECQKSVKSTTSQLKIIMQ